MEYPFRPNSLYYGDCLDVLSGWPAASVDLIYLDPPFNSNADYNVIFGTEGPKSPGETQVLAFKDTWYWNAEARTRVSELKRTSIPIGDTMRGLEHILGESGMLAYLSYMAQRLVQCRRVLKETGSIYLHCDTTAGHYLKVVMDAIFEKKNFRNEIIWHYSGWNKKLRDKLESRHDNIYFYINGKSPTFHSVTRAWKSVEEDVWQIAKINNSSRERFGYPTQKPLTLLQRIIQASSNQGDIILDPFCGCGTTVEAAANLNRQFIGIDIASFAIDIIVERRLQGLNVPVFGVPLTMDDAARMVQEDPFAFEKWAIERIPGLLANQVQVGDGGIDGRGHVAHPLEDTDASLVISQVKGGAYQPNDLRAFKSVMDSEGAALGIFITLRKLQGRQRRNAEALAASGSYRQGASEFPRLQLWSIEEYFDGRFPNLPTLAHPITGKPLRGSLI